VALMTVGLLQGSTKEAPGGRCREDDDRGGRGNVLADEHADVIREAVKAAAAEMMEIEVAALIGTQRGERRPEDRATRRNGYRPRRWDTRAGELELQIPNCGSAATSHRSWSRASASERALLAGVQQRRCPGRLGPPGRPAG
jgi:hypothetical protein